MIIYSRTVCHQGACAVPTWQSQKMVILIKEYESLIVQKDKWFLKILRLYSYRF